MRLVYTYIAIWCGLCVCAQSKSDTLDGYGEIRPLLIYAPKIDPNKELVSTTLLKSNPTMSLSSLLQKQSGIYVRSNGASGLNTASYKGLGSLQTPVVINGANIQSAMNGTVDVSLVNAYHFQNLELNNTSNNTLGSPNMGAALALSTIYNAETKWEVNTGINSLLTKNISSRFSTTIRRLHFTISATVEQSPNEVSLQRYGRDANQDNADYKSVSLLQSIQGKLTKKISWHNTIYAFDTERGVPPTLIDNSQSRQADRNGTMINKFFYSTDIGINLMLSNQLAYQQIVFNNPNTEETNNRAVTSNSLLRLEREFNRTQVYLGIANEQTNYLSGGIAEQVGWNRWRVFSHIKYEKEKVKTLIEAGLQPLNGELYSNATARLTYTPVYMFQSAVQLSKVYRLPTLNELYWYEPGRAFGNPDLEPEHGYKAELDAIFKTSRVYVRINPHVGYFQNWVEWRGFPIIRPRSVREVFVSGVEASSSYSHALSWGKIIISANYNWVRSIYLESNTIVSANQLIFTPAHTGSTTLTFKTKKWSAYTNAHLVGENFISSDNSTSLTGYTLIEIGGFYELSALRFGSSITNLTNEAYFTQPNSPLPGRVFHLNINYNIPLKSKS